MHLWNSGVRLRPLCIVSRSPSLAALCSCQATPTSGSRVSNLGGHSRPTHPCYQLSKICCSPMGRCSATLWISQPTAVAPPWTSSSRQIPFPVMLLFTSGLIVCLLLPSDHVLCACHLSLSRPSSTGLDLTSTTLRVRDWPSVLSSCHPSLATWHLGSHPCPDIPGRTSVLDTLFDRRPHPTFARAPPSTHDDAPQPSSVDHARFHPSRQQFHSTVRSSRSSLPP